MSETKTTIVNSLDDVATPDLQEDAPLYRADIGKGKWKAPPSEYKAGRQVFVKLKNGGMAGPFTITKCHEPNDAKAEWKYDVKDGSGKEKFGIAETKLSG